MKTRSNSTRVGLHVALGAFVGVAYTLTDAYLDRQLGIAVSRPTNPIQVLHTLVDLVLPTLTGALLAVAAHVSTLRSRMAELEKARAENLEGQIRKIERDQAVWVVAASLLHELKNPLHSLGLLLDEALELPEGQQAEQRELLKRARAQSEKISAELGLLRGLPSAYHPELPNVDLRTILERSVLAHTPAARRQGIELALDGDVPFACVNPEYLEVILDNLLENAFDALKDQGAGGLVAIDATAAEDGRVKVRMVDTGPGVSSEAKARLFEPLWSSKPKGLGLGLATARALARAMGGNITHRAELGRTVFELELRGVE